MLKRSILFVCLALTAFVTSSYAVEAVNETFENYTYGSINGQGNWTSWVEPDLGGKVEIVSSPVHSGSKSLHLEKFASIAMYTTNSTSGGNAIISFWWRGTSFSQSDTGYNCAMWAQINLSDGYNGDSTYLSICHHGHGHRSVKLADIMGNGYCYGGTGDLIADKWYFIEIEYDFVNRTARARVDGGRWGENLHLNVVDPNSYVTTVEFMTTWSNEEEFYIDDFRIADKTMSSMPILTIIPDPYDAGLVTGPNIKCGEDSTGSWAKCQNTYRFGSRVSLSARANSGWAFKWWDDGKTCYTNNPLNLTMNGPKTLTARFDNKTGNDIQFPGFLGNQTFSRSISNYHRFTLLEPAGIAILSTGNMDLRGTLYQLQADNQRILAPDLDHSNHVSSGFKDVTGKHVNFMIRPGDATHASRTKPIRSEGFTPLATATQYRQLPAGTYELEVQRENVTAGQSYGILLLKRPETVKEFFQNLLLLLNDGDTKNDYLDIYVKALYPELYPDLDSPASTTNWGQTVTYQGLHWSRQCKALNNFYLTYVLGVDYMEDDCTINAAMNNNEDDMLRGQGTVVYNGISNPIFGSLDDVSEGDVWVKKMNLVCVKDKYKSGYNHYGLAIGSGEIIDANYCPKGRLCVAGIKDRLPTKVVTPATP